MNNETSIKEYNEFARLHNYSYIIHNGKVCGYRKGDYNVTLSLRRWLDGHLNGLGLETVRSLR